MTARSKFSADLIEAALDGKLRRKKRSSNFKDQKVIFRGKAPSTDAIARLFVRYFKDAIIRGIAEGRLSEVANSPPEQSTSRKPKRRRKDKWQSQLFCLGALLFGFEGFVNSHK